MKRKSESDKSCATDRTKMNQAFSVYINFLSAKYGYPKDERLGKAFPELDEETIRSWNKMFSQVDSRILEIYREGGWDKYSNKEMTIIYSTEFPFLDKESIEECLSLTLFHKYK